MDKEFLNTMSSFRSASLVFSSPEAHYNSFSHWYLVAHARTCCDVMHRHKMKFCNEQLGTRLYFPPLHNFRAWVQGLTHYLL